MRTLSALLLVCSLATAAPLKTIQVGDSPESVCRGFDGKLYVTVMNSRTEAGDGVIKVVDGDKVSVFATGFDDPKGICFTGEFLVATDIERVWKIDSTGKASVLAGPEAFPHPPSFLNDVACAPEKKSVFVTDTGAVPKMFTPDNKLWPLDSAEARAIPQIGRLYRIGLDGKVSTVIEPCAAMLNPNGVTAPEPGLLLVAEFFHGNILSHRDGKLTTLATGFRGADAIVRDSKGKLYLSSWSQGKVWKLDPGARNPQVIAEGLQSPADHCIDEKAGVIIVPEMKAGALKFYPLEPAKP
jgi:sugar lactone lactonase YvrE